MNAQTIQSAWEAFVAAISEGKTERAAVILAIEAADESRAKMVSRLQFKYAKKEAAA